jgi:short-subunit dehydrogenase
MKIHRYGVRADYVVADLRKATEVETVWSTVIGHYPDGIDILINCAGYDRSFRFNRIISTSPIEID